MEAKNIIIKELIKRGYSFRGNTKVWDVSDSKLWFLTPELSQAFLKFKQKGFYREHVVDREIDLLKNNASRIVEKAGVKTFNLIEIGSTDGERAEALIKNFSKDIKIRYCPIDVSSYFVGKVVGRIKGLSSLNVTDVKPYVQGLKNFDDIVASLKGGDYQQNVILLLGSLLTMGEVTNLLFKLSGSMLNGDLLVIGNGVRTGDRLAELEKYKSDVFDKWFIHIMKDLGFNEKEIKYDARFAHGRVEGFYKIKTDKHVAYDSKHINFRTGDEVVIGIHYKYYEQELRELCGLYFKDVEIIKDPTGNHALILCKK